MYTQMAKRYGSLGRNSMYGSELDDIENANDDMSSIIITRQHNREMSEISNVRTNKGRHSVECAYTYISIYLL